MRHRRTRLVGKHQFSPLPVHSGLCERRLICRKHDHEIAESGPTNGVTPKRPPFCTGAIPSNSVATMLLRNSCFRGFACLQSVSHLCRVMEQEQSPNLHRVPFCSAISASP